MVERTGATLRSKNLLYQGAEEDAKKRMEGKILNVFRAHTNEFISGEELSRRLGVSRAAIWKHIEKLRQEGYDISAQPHLGYKLVGIPDRLLPAEVKWKLDTTFIGQEIYSYAEVGSTMDVAFRLASDNAQEGTVVFGESQTKGRGRMGRSWSSPNQKGIYCSVILRPNIIPSQAPMVTVVAAVSVIRGIRKLTHLPALIKWPNDILINNRKVCGILTEMNAETDRVKFIIVGIGVNVNREKDSLPRGATSIMKEFGEEVARVDLAKEILRELERYYLLFKTGAIQQMIMEWRNLSAILGYRVKVTCQDRVIEGQAHDLDSNGALILRLDSGFLEKVLAGDVMRVR